ncbi:MAG: GIY-YIG nuclease family protein [Chloroflexi bacterium]|nr:GIY-YIG nuclease family protein [Chloroflexota bacterium]
MRTYYVYILTNATHKLYVGMTNDLQRRMYEHKRKLVPGFTSRYNLSWLAYYETTSDVHAAIAREKQIKGWLRSRKTALLESANPHWVDLSAEWFDALDSSPTSPDTRDLSGSA